MKTDTNAERKNSFVIDVRKCIQGNYPLNCVGAMDEVAVLFEDGISSAPRAQTRRMTAVVAASADGSKAPPFVIIETRRDPEQGPEGLHTAASASGFMTKAVMSSWLHSCWMPFVSGSPALLILDRFVSHTAVQVRFLLGLAR
eukprot:GHVU01130625.1.p1 GENE.GHVU01130625.1~~GHVU01130625.1.p1  ORF type:complete len:143 (-),score=5.47 GHVU01130625.1:1164-1592(-)